VDDENTQLINELQKNSFSPAPISVQLTSRTMTYIWFPWLWYLALCGRSLHCVTQSGWRWSTFVNCDNIQQERLSATALRCWSKLTYFTLPGEFILSLLSPFLHWRVGRGSVVAVSCFTFILDYSPIFSTVCEPFAYLCTWLQFIISIGHTFHGKSDWFWASSDSGGLADVCARTPPDP
jgi:hypothetical protein